MDTVDVACMRKAPHERHKCSQRFLTPPDVSVAEAVTGPIKAVRKVQLRQICPHAGPCECAACCQLCEFGGALTLSAHACNPAEACSCESYVVGRQSALVGQQPLACLGQHSACRVRREFGGQHMLRCDVSRRDHALFRVRLAAFAGECGKVRPHACELLLQHGGRLGRHGNRGVQLLGSLFELASLQGTGRVRVTLGDRSRVHNSEPTCIPVPIRYTNEMPHRSQTGCHGSSDARFPGLVTGERLHLGQQRGQMRLQVLPAPGPHERPCNVPEVHRAIVNQVCAA